MSETSREAQVAAKWWADKLRAGFEPNNGSVDEEGTVANLRESNPAVGFLFSRANDEAGLTPEKIDAFEAALAENIQEELDKDYLSDYGRTFGVDYHPDPILSKALATAEIRETMTMLPWKTHMRVKPGKITVGEGYGAQWKEIACD